MKNQTYRFNIGSFNCIALSDGTMTYAPPMFPPPDIFLFSNAEEAELSQVMQKHGISLNDWKEWVSPYTCLFVDTGRNTVLIDTGAGSLTETTGKLLQNMKTEGISPEEIQYVILSHGHPDHVGGNLDSSGKTYFSQAMWIIMKSEWEFWTTEKAEHQLDEHNRDTLLNIARTNLLPLEKMVDLVEDGDEIIPGIRVLNAAGHTPGHMAVSIISGDDKLLCISDAVIHPVHLAQPKWFSAVDVAPAEVVETRQRLLNKAFNEHSLVMAFHFPFPGIGYVQKENNGWKWQPIENAG